MLRNVLRSHDQGHPGGEMGYPHPARRQRPHIPHPVFWKVGQHEDITKGECQEKQCRLKQGNMSLCFLTSWNQRRSGWAVYVSALSTDLLPVIKAAIGSQSAERVCLQQSVLNPWQLQGEKILQMTWCLICRGGNFFFYNSNSSLYRILPWHS